MTTLRAPRPENIGSFQDQKWREGITQKVNRLSIFEGDLGALDSRVDAVEVRLDSLEPAVAANTAAITSLNSAVGSLNTRVTALETAPLKVLPNNTYLKSRNAANSADIGLVKLDSTDNVLIHAEAGKSITLGANNDNGWTVLGTSDLMPNVPNLVIASSSRPVGGLYVNNLFAPGVLAAGTLGTNPLDLYTNSVKRWSLDGSAGHLIPGVNLTLHVGSNSFGCQQVWSQALLCPSLGGGGIMGIGTTANDHIQFSTNSLSRWYINNGGILHPDAPDTYDIGYNGGQVRAVYTANVNGQTALTLCGSLVAMGRNINFQNQTVDGSNFWLIKINGFNYKIAVVAG